MMMLLTRPESCANTTLGILDESWVGSGAVMHSW